MLRFMVPLILILAVTASSAQERSLPRLKYSAASESQINFAIENKYDDTGPGSRQPEYAYNTYSTLEDALIGYLDDPDTKLPEHERAKAVQKLVKNQPHYQQKQEIQRFYPKTVEEYTGYRKPQAPPLAPTKYVYQEKKLPAYFQVPETKYSSSADFDGKDSSFFKAIGKRPAEPFRLKKIQVVKGSPLSLAHYTRDPDFEDAHDQFNPHPKYTFSYGVHDKDTGDLKSAQETREGGTVHGYYSFLDADGKQRVVHYTADDKLGFRATVQRTAGDDH